MTADNGVFGYFKTYNPVKKFIMINKQQSGFSLLELVIAMTLIIMMTGIAIPSYSTLFNKTHDQLASEQLLQAIRMTRNEAMLRGVTVTLCKSGDHQHCSGNWSDGQIIFVDANNDKIPIQDNIIYVIDGLKAKGVLHWQSSLHRDYLSFSSLGAPFGEDGAFWFCRSNESKASWAVVVNQAGRARRVTDVKKYSC